jgi:hypothetical protein
MQVMEPTAVPVAADKASDFDRWRFSIAPMMDWAESL